MCRKLKDITERERMLWEKYKRDEKLESLDNLIRVLDERAELLDNKQREINDRLAEAAG